MIWKSKFQFILFWNSSFTALHKLQLSSCNITDVNLYLRVQTQLENRDPGTERPGSRSLIVRGALAKPGWIPWQIRYNGNNASKRNTLLISLIFIYRIFITYVGFPLEDADGVNSGMAGGTLIADSWVLTSAHIFMPSAKLNNGEQAIALMIVVFVKSFILFYSDGQVSDRHEVS